ncbi:hypothetical protein EDD15DRAFT_2168373 [Pisolithus albus]|nr:hypothetical protein EDD15DRAFT_2168373 [Pisolithus albus]
MTKSNRQCLRTVRLPPTHAISDPVPTVYCYQHQRSAADDIPRPAFHATPSSSSASALPGQATARCSGTTKSNSRCLRTVRLPPTHSISDPLPIVYCFQHQRPAFVVTPTSPHATPSSSSASSFPDQLAVRCAGTTEANEQCSRTVKLPPTHAMLDPMPATYCYQHGNMKETGFYVTGVGRADRYVEFKDYVPEYLRGATQLALKEEMARAPSESDCPGYIYALEVRDPSTTHLLQLKVGRTVSVNRRLDQWDKQCGLRQQVLRGWWPGTIELDSDSGTNGSLLGAYLKAGDPSPLCHRLERLVHIELTDLSLYAPYLEPEWPQTNNSEQSLSVAGSLSNGPSAVQRAGHCKDCGVVHREIFSFRRPNGGKYQGREWEDIVKPVIEKWGRFIKEYYS